MVIIQRHFGIQIPVTIDTSILVGSRKVFSLQVIPNIGDGLVLVLVAVRAVHAVVLASDVVVKLFIVVVGINNNI